MLNYCVQIKSAGKVPRQHETVSGSVSYNDIIILLGSSHILPFGKSNLLVGSSYPFEGNTKEWTGISVILTCTVWSVSYGPNDHFTEHW